MSSKSLLNPGVPIFNGKIALAFLFLVFSATLAAAKPVGGTCPTGATYGPYQNQTLNQAFGTTSCYYVAANGSDSNDGLSELGGHPWLHSPGMPNCTANCASIATTCGGGAGNCAGIGFIHRGGDTWHFGNPSASPYTGGLWSWPWGAYANCNFGQTNTGCIYFGVDQSWSSGSQWARPILTADNPLAGSRVANCSYSVPGGNNQMINQGPGTVLDNFEMLGLCTSDVSPGNTADFYIVYNGTGEGGTGTAFVENLYAHGWTASTAAGGGTTLACGVLGGGYNGLQAIDHVVIDGSDSDDQVCAWGTFPSFYHFKDNIVRYTTQGVGQWCHDIHDNIFEFIDNPDVATHGNGLECNADSNGTAAYQPQNTPNVFYNNIIRHFTTGFSKGGQVTLWFCPNASPSEYWFNNLEYDVGNSNYWDIAGPPIYNCSNSGGQYMFNNTLVDGTQPCSGSVNSAGGQYLYVYNEHLINTPFATGSYSNCNGNGDPSNIAMSDTTATSQGYTNSAGRINTQNSSTNCANDSTTPCTPSSSSNSTVGAGGNKTATYCATLATFSSEPAIGTDAANACKYGTTDGCGYNLTTHAMSCPSQLATSRPQNGAWDAGGYEYTSGGNPPNPPSDLTAVVQ